MLEYDYSELSGIITKVFGGQRGFAKALKKSESHVSMVLNNKIYLRQPEMDKWIVTLGIPESDVGRVFFTH